MKPCQGVSSIHELDTSAGVRQTHVCVPETQVVLGATTRPTKALPARANCHQTPSGNTQGETVEQSKHFLKQRRNQTTLVTRNISKLNKPSQPFGSPFARTPSAACSVCRVKIGGTPEEPQNGGFPVGNQLRKHKPTYGEPTPDTHTHTHKQSQLQTTPPMLPLATRARLHFGHVSRAQVVHSLRLPGAASGNRGSSKEGSRKSPEYFKEGRKEGRNEGRKEGRKEGKKENGDSKVTACMRATMIQASGTAQEGRITFNFIRPKQKNKKNKTCSAAS